MFLFRFFFNPNLFGGIGENADEVGMSEWRM
jgi:hypothetical protein